MNIASKMLQIKYFVAAAATALLAIVYAVATTSSPAATYTNPILIKAGADPWVVRHDGYYLMTYTTNDNITILKSSVLTDWNNAEEKVAFIPESGKNYSFDLWAPELHNINDRWYVIFTADIDPDSPKPSQDMLCDYNCPAVNHRMFVLESSCSDPWESNYTMKAELNTYDQFAIDGTYFSHGDELYHIYSCWYDAYISWPAMLCISKMSDAWTISSSLEQRQIISKPTNAWEKTPYNRTVNDRLSSNEGPQQLTNPTTGQRFVIYSAARSDNRNYCLGLLEFNPTKAAAADPLDINSWYKNNAGCVFEQNPEEEAYGVGHASFTTSPDGSENWIVYHGMRDPTDGWSARTIRTQKFTWDEKTGWPVFGEPGYGPYDVPSGQ